MVIMDLMDLMVELAKEEQIALFRAQQVLLVQTYHTRTPWSSRHPGNIIVTINVPKKNQKKKWKPSLATINQVHNSDNTNKAAKEDTRLPWYNVMISDAMRKQLSTSLSRIVQRMHKYASRQEFEKYLRHNKPNEYKEYKEKVKQNIVKQEDELRQRRERRQFLRVRPGEQRRPVSQSRLNNIRNDQILKDMIEKQRKQNDGN